MNPLDSWSVRC